MEQAAESEDKQFKWGKKRVTGEEMKDVQFYESFTYGGSEYCLYDCVLIGDATKPDSSELYVGKIINLWEHNDQRENSRRVELLWFFKPSEVSLYVGVQDALANELFLASGTGVGLTNENRLEAICGKCNVLCISKDIRNPQPSDEEIKLADFLFYRTFDVGSRKILEKMDDKIAGVDVEFVFNRHNCEEKVSAVQKVATDVHGTADSLKPNPPSTSGSVRQNECKGSDFSGHRKSDYGYKKEKDNECHKQLAMKKSTVPEERANQDSGRRDGGLYFCIDSGSRRNDCHQKDQDSEAEKHSSKQTSRLAEERCSKDFYRLDDLSRKKRRVDGSVSVSDGREKLRLQEERYCFDDIPQKKRELDGSVAVSDGRPKKSQKIRHDGRKDIEPIRSPRDNVAGGELYSQKPSHTDKKQDLRIPRFSEGKGTKLATEKDYFKKPNSDCKSKLTEGKVLTDANYRRHYRVFEVTQKPDAEENKWYRDLPWEENVRCAEEQGNLVLLRNLDPTYTSKEVEDIVYSDLNEQCTARIIERTSATIPHIGEALVIFKTIDAAKRAIRRLYEGCLLLSNGRILVATNTKVNPPTKPPFQFSGHIKPRAQMRQKRTNAVATSHSSQTNSVGFEMGLDWVLYQDRCELTWKRIFEVNIDHH
ncbi:unnamed protein product [Arabis nemorensis]|uniref:BAH domain-containing protein n=1 Tax=Arabis nemorensis TaxID=586526 RepID=A0A565CUD1_9BRAS|nr:unnamed protein product [Arabis nemorensis]